MTKKARMQSTTKRMRKSRIGKTNRVPKTRCSGKWTEAAFFAFLRSGLRNMSRRWRPLVMDALVAARRPSQSKKNLRLKWQFQCCRCLKWKSRKNVEVNHRIPVGSFNCIEQAGEYIARLFCEVDELEVMCKRCHLQETADQRASKKAVTAKVWKHKGLH